jgi:CheY-like chemotaxis protein
VRILILDDESDTLSLELLQRTLKDALDAHVRVCHSVEAAVEAVHAEPYDLVVTDVFVPIEARPGGTLGRRAARFEDHYAHLGGLVFLDELDRLQSPPRVLVHTACTDAPLIEVLDELGHERVRKPAPPDALLSAVLSALGLPTPSF